MLQPADRATDLGTHAGPAGGDAAAATGAPAGRVASQAGALVGGGPIQAKDAGGAPGAPGAGAPGGAPDGGGAAALPDGVKAKMESAFGADFSAVKVHTNSPQAQAIGAHAFAQGSDVHFAPGQFAPGSEEGDALIGHELAHVVQQSAGTVSAPQGKGGLNGDAGLEHEADVAGAAAARGQAAHVEGASAGVQAKANTSAPVQAKLAGSASALAAAAGHDPKVKKGMFSKRRTTWEKLLDAVADYEKREKAAVDAKSALGKSAKAKLLAGLTEIETLGEQYLQDNAEMLRFDFDKVDTLEQGITKEEKAARVKQNNSSRNAKKKLEASPEGMQTRMRGSVVKMMLPRVRLERADITSGRWSPTANFDDGHVDATQVEDDAVGGALNRLDKVGYGTQAGYFKQDKNIEGGDAGFAAGIGTMNEGSSRVYDANNGARSVAMSRLDELLGAGLMAKTEFGTHSSTTGNDASAPNATSKLGTFMAKADGQDAGSLAGGGQLAVSDAHKAEMGNTGKPVVSLSDPTVQRSMNIMQIVDAIAGQLDRHTGNYLFKVGANGAVERVTGIDLDMAFGSQQLTADKASGGNKSHFKGLPVIYDRAFATTVLQVTTTQLRSVLAPLLTPAEVDAAVSRLVYVQNSIKVALATGKMVDQWDETTARQQTADDTSYVGKARLEAFVGLLNASIRKSSRPDAQFWARVQGSITSYDHPDLRPTHLELTIQAMDRARAQDPTWVKWQRLTARLNPLDAEQTRLHAELVKIRHALGDDAGEDPEYTRLAKRWTDVGNQRLALNNGVKESDWAVAAMDVGIRHFIASPDSHVLPKLPPAPELPANTEALLDSFEQEHGLPSTKAMSAPTGVQPDAVKPQPVDDEHAMVASGGEASEAEAESEEAPVPQAPTRIPGGNRPLPRRAGLPGYTPPFARNRMAPRMPMPPTAMAQGTQSLPVKVQAPEADATASLSGLGVLGGATTQPVPEQVLARNDQQTGPLVGHAPVPLTRRPLPRKVHLRRDLGKAAPDKAPDASTEAASEALGQVPDASTEVAPPVTDPRLAPSRFPGFVQGQVDRAIAHGWVEGEDDLATVVYFSCLSDNPVFEGEPGLRKVNATLPGARSNKDEALKLFPSRRYDAQFNHLNDAQLMSLCLYTTNAAYPLNAMLRGLLKSKAWVDAYGPYIDPLGSGIRSLRAGVKNHQDATDKNLVKYQELMGTRRTAFNGRKVAARHKEAEALLPSLHSKMVSKDARPSDRLDVKTVYRNMRYEGVDFSQFVVGNTITENGFSSTSAKKNAYGATDPIRWTIQNVKNARSLAGISGLTNEFELLLPPGQQFKVVRIERVKTDGSNRTPVANPLAQFPSGTHTEAGYHWEIVLDHSADVGGGDHDGPHSEGSEAESEG